MIVVVTGGRDFAASLVVDNALGTLHQQDPIVLVAHGGCGVTIQPNAAQKGNMRGADRLAADWASYKHVQAHPFYVDHRVDGPWPAAGQRRNGRMLKAIVGMNVARASSPPLAPLPVLVVAFDGGRGTDGCVKQALELGLRVWRVHGAGPYWTETLEPR